MKETTLTGQSTDIVSENIQKLKQIFPEVFCEESIDFEKLQAVLGEYTDEDKERYNFTWWGKGKALRLAQTPSMGTLRPCKVESKNWDTTENLYIEGDNLEVLKLLQKSYHRKVKMIYIDPPYNTGKDFVYKDNYKDPLKSYLEMTEQVDGEGKKISTNSESGGRFHTNWLNMMYPRLRLARNLLREDGVIFISIDDNEVQNMKILGNEIFGEENFVANVVWKRKRGRDNSARWFSKSHEYLLIYAKIKDYFSTNFLELDEETKKAYKNPENDPRGIYRMLAVWARGTQGGVRFDFTNKDGQYFKERLWLMSKQNLTKLDEEDKLIIRGDNIYRKLFIYENKGKIPETIWDHMSNAANASDEIKDCFGGIIFDTPKPIPYIIECLKIATSKEAIVLDFFSGSATTAHSVMQLNAEDGGKRKIIMVQLPQPTDEKSEAYKAGYKNICEIGKERICRAGEKIKAELQEKQNKQQSMLEDNKTTHPDDLDIGFKVFKLDSSNLKKWNPDASNLEASLLDSIENYVDGRSELDVVYEIMQKYGIDLTFPIEEVEIGSKKIYSIGYGALMICLDSEITTEVANEIVRLKETLKPEVLRVVFKDNGFADDSVKTNTKEILRNAGIDEIVSV
ncbi:MAG: site-specific DNA-methyltransferase [Anaerolineaceae bacterium]|nr:site-specific DNA-methyltransferase [Anaerolineaceae bacterium]